VLVRRELPGDRPGVRRLHAAAFDRPALRGAEAPEARLVDLLRDGGHLVAALSLVAVADGGLVGHVACSSGTVDGRALLALGPLGVLPEHQRRGVGSALVHTALGAADALDEPAVVLLGDPAYYSRFGFEPATRHGLLPADPAWSTAFQVRRLSTWDASLQGTFRFAPPFDDL